MKHTQTTLVNTNITKSNTTKYKSVRCVSCNNPEMSDIALGLDIQKHKESYANTHMSIRVQWLHVPDPRDIVLALNFQKHKE